MSYNPGNGWLEGENFALRQQNLQAKYDACEYENQLAEGRDHSDWLNQIIDTRNARISALVKTDEELRDHITAQESDIGTLQRQLSEKHALLQQHDVYGKAMRDGLVKSQQGAASLHTMLVAAETRIAKAEVTSKALLANAQARETLLNTSLAKTEARIADLNTSLAKTETRENDLRIRLTVTKKRASVAEAKLKRSRLMFGALDAGRMAEGQAWAAQHPNSPLLENSGECYRDPVTKQRDDARPKTAARIIMEKAFDERLDLSGVTDPENWRTD